MAPNHTSPRPLDHLGTCITDKNSESEPRHDIAEQEHKVGPEQCEDDTPRGRSKVPAARRSISSLSSQSSAVSEHTDISMDSLPEPLGGERPLTIPKRRDTKASQSTQIQSDVLYGVLLNDCRESMSQEKGVADIMASLRQMSLTDTSPETNRRGTFGESDGLAMTGLQSTHSRASHIPRPYHGLSSRSSLMYLDRRCNGSGSESTSSCYSDILNNARTGSRNILQRPSPSPSFRSAPGVPTSGFGAHTRVQNLRNSPWLRTAKSMYQISAAATPPQGHDVEMSISPPVSAMGTESNSDVLGGGDGSGVTSRGYSSDSRRSSFDDPYVLVPNIVVTPESKTLEDGATGLWAAVQISTEIRPANASAYIQDDSQFIRGPSQLDMFRYGCLYDVNVEVLATEGSVIVDVLNDKSYETNSTLYPGSRLLVIVHVKILDQSSPPGRVHGLHHARESSDDLIQDLEHHLGNKLIEYLQVRIRYHHSSFPDLKYDQSADPEGTLEVQTAIETTARAAIKQHNSSSFWSPRPTIQANPLFEIIASHWGPGRAGEVMQRIVNSHSTAHHAKERKSTPMAKRLPMIPSGLDPQDHRRTHIPIVEERSEETLKQNVVPVPTRVPPPIPQRHASLQHFPPKASSDEKLQSRSPQATETSPKTKTAWTQVRRTSGAEFNTPESTITQRSLMKRSVSRSPSAEMPGSPSSNSIELPHAQSSLLSRSKSTNSGKQRGSGISGAAYSLRGSRFLSSRAPEPQQSTDLRRSGIDGRIRTGDYSASNAVNHRTDPATMDWVGGGDGTLGRTSKRVGNEMLDEERARRRQKMLSDPPATISVAGGGSRRWGMGSLHRGSAGGAGTVDSFGSRRFQPSPASSADLYRAAGGKEMALGGGRGQWGFEHQGSDGGRIYPYGGSKARKNDKSGTGGTATGRWGWAGWWP